jgi:hypothetical protein
MKLRMFVLLLVDYIICHSTMRLDAANAEIVCKTGRKIYRESKKKIYKLT